VPLTPIVSPSVATSRLPPSIDPTEETIQQVNAALNENPWHFMEAVRYIDVSGLAPLSQVIVGDDRPVLTQVLRNRVAELLTEAGWVVVPGEDQEDPRWLQVRRPAHLPPVVRFVGGAWVSDAPATSTGTTGLGSPIVSVP